jgi:cAMP phosphodiesterase
MNNETLQKMHPGELFDFYEDASNDIVARLRARAMLLAEMGDSDDNLDVSLLQHAANEIEAARRYEASVNQAISECGGYQP